MVNMIVSGWRTQVLHVAAQLQLAEHLVQRPATAATLAEAMDCSGDGMARLLRALCALGVCRERADGRFALTAAGRLLCAEVPTGAGASATASLRPLALWWGGSLWPMWGELMYSVRTGASAREKLTGDVNYSFLNKGGEVASNFHDAMRAMTQLIVADVAALPTWRSVRTLVDVGGGHGELACALLAQHAGLRATVFDLPHAQVGAQAQIGSAGLAARCRFEAGSFFEAVPTGADRYLLKSILHNWNDQRCADILARCRAAVSSRSRLLLLERVRPERLRPTEHDEALARTDLNMLAGLGGRERSLAEFSLLLRDAGFEVVGLQATGFEFSVIEARPVTTSS